MGRPAVRLMISSPNFACVLEAGESTRLLRVEGSLPNYYEVHIAGKGDNSLQHYNMGHTFIPMPQALKIPAAKAAVDKEWEKLGKIPTWDKTRVRNKSVCLFWRRLRVIHVIVKTEEMQKLRMKFVLYCTTWISNLNKIYQFPSVNRSTSLPLDSRHEHCDAWGLKVCLAVHNPSKDEEKSHITSLVHGFLQIAP